MSIVFLLPLQNIQKALYFSKITILILSMKLIYTLLLSAFSLSLFAQTASIKGQLQDADGNAIVFSNVILFNAADSSMAKVETTDDAGIFQIQGITPGQYFLTATYVGLSDLTRNDLTAKANEILDLGVLAFAPQAIELEQATVKATRAIVEVKPDRTVFNVQGTINSVGSNAIELLRKAPSVTVDNNDNVSVLGRAGVLVYVDGKRLPLGGTDLSNYLQNLQADQIDRIDIITNPGAKYEAEGNAGIIDIRLKKDKNLGSNGTISGTYTQGQLTRYNGSASANYRNKAMNVFGTLGYGDYDTFNNMNFQSFQNDLQLLESNRMRNNNENINFRLGTDFFLNKKHTLGFLVMGGNSDIMNLNANRIVISQEDNPLAIDSILVADNINAGTNSRMSYNLNYKYDIGKSASLNVDLDYGRYQNDSDREQPNQYFDATETNVVSEVLNSFNTETDIDIYTAKLDFEKPVFGGQFGIGGKYSKVVTDNLFEIFDGINGSRIRIDSSSNRFEYDESVTAGYVSYARPLGKKWNVSAGLRVEHSDIMGELTAFTANGAEDPVDLNYVSWFPSFGLTYQAAPMHSWAFNYGRRINRPDYNVLNPFNNRLSEISFEKGNPFLNPEIVNNIEVGYTYAYRFNFKLGYSKTEDQITRLIRPAGNGDDRSTIITWDNLAKQQIFSFSASLPFQFNKWWSAYMNLGANYQKNEATYPSSNGTTAVVDIGAFNYNIYQQHTFTLPFGFKGEISGWFSGPGIWGGVFEYETSWSLNLGLQKKFLQDALNVRISANDLFYESGWNGVSRFDGLTSIGYGNWDSRNVSLSISYNFGNQNVKSRRRKTGIENEAGRVSN